jgi:DNA processing protein
MALLEEIALTLLPNIGHRKVRTILQHIDTESFFRVSKRRLKEIPSIGDKTLISLNREEALLKAEAYLNFFEKNEILPTFYQSDDFPFRLNQCEDAPILLFKKGKMHFNQPKVISIVGTRNATKYGKRCIDELLDGLKDQQVVVVSGLAYGIDVYAHQRCVELGIQTIGVLGHGLDRIYPSVHKNVAQQMLENGGLLSEFLPGTLPDREHFPMRNRIVAGMCDATIVIESGEKGGSMITAELANDYSRDVFAFPGNVESEFSKGCNLLIQKQKAHLITNSSDFIQWMSWDKTNENKVIQQSLFPNLSEEEQMIVGVIQEKKEISIDVLSIKTEINSSKLTGILLKLELEGVVQQLPGMRYKSL